MLFSCQCGYVFQDTRQLGEELRIFTRQVGKKLVQFIESVNEREKHLARLVSGFVFLLVNPEFYSHLASWRVVIHTPGSLWE
jgi:hypothetical protein